jgi:hypothetical protein
MPENIKLGQEEKFVFAKVKICQFANVLKVPIISTNISRLQGKRYYDDT